MDAVRPVSAGPPALSLRSRLRRIWRTIHLWIGLSAGLVLAIVGLSGAVLVFAEPIARAEHGDILFPDRPMPDPSGWAPVETWIAKATARYPQLEHVIVVAAPYSAPLPAAVPLVAGHLRHDPGTPEKHGAVAVDPASGEPLGLVVIEDSWWGWLVHLHGALLAPPYGYVVTAVAGLLFLASAVSGLYLWWPRNGRTWRQALTVKRGARGRRMLLDWHNVAAVWLFVPLAVAVLSGVYILRPAWFDGALRAASTIRAPGPQTLAAPARATCPDGTGIGRALAVARAAHPDLDLRLMIMPEQAALPYQISLAPRGAPGRVQSTELWVARDCPRILLARTGHDLSAAETVKAWMSAVHASFGLGLIGQIAVFASGLCLPLLFVTGLLLWTKRRAARSPRV
ncbi:PepSY-associated TM helix domain-containing protein [Methylobacterium oryzisoli]|uniref:PepSY-associated TM helix domain-containing protein n=1 Tax=Methylobacterium oryzisoli TaxID=3385502 RepID=UPI003891BDC8